VRPEGLRRRVHGGQEWEAMQREIKKKNMYQAASFTGDLGEAGFLASESREGPVPAPANVAV
jgi:hypothetical protein